MRACGSGSSGAVGGVTSSRGLWVLGLFLLLKPHRVLVPERDPLPEGLPVHVLPVWKPGPVCKERAHPGQVKGHSEGVVTGCMEVARVRVHPAQGGALLVHATERWTLKGGSRNVVLPIRSLSWCSLGSDICRKFWICYLVTVARALPYLAFNLGVVNMSFRSLGSLPQCGSYKSYSSG